MGDIVGIHKHPPAKFFFFSKKIHYQAPSFKLTRRNGDKSTMKIQLYIGLAIVLWAASESEAAASMEGDRLALGDLIPLTKGNRNRRGWGAACLPSGSACGGYGTKLTCCGSCRRQCPGCNQAVNNAYVCS